VSILAELVALRGSTPRVSEAVSPASGGRPASEATGAVSTGSHDQGGQAADAEEVTDPVCGMMVIPSRARFTADHDGQSHWFCAAGCETAFRRDPDRYLGSRQ